MSAIKEKAVDMIRRMPEENMFYVFNILQNLEGMSASKTGEKARALEALADIQKYIGRLSEDFDADKELEDARDEKYGNIGRH